jgi:hypothetical protein
MEIVNLSSNDDWKLMPFNISFSLILTKQMVFSRGTPRNSEIFAEQNIGCHDIEFGQTLPFMW